MSVEAAAVLPERASGGTKLAVLLAMAMFVLVVDTSLMNVSISAVVQDLDTTASGVQSAIALEALVSAAFILIGSKIGDLIGRKRAYVARPARLRGRRARDDAGPEPPRRSSSSGRSSAGSAPRSCCPRCSRSIHGNFEGPMQRKAYALVGASAAIAAAVGPLLGGFVTTYLSWRVGFLGRGRDHRDRPARHQARPRRAVHRLAAESTSSARSSRRSAWAGSCSASSSGRKAAERVGALMALGAVALGVAGLVARAAQARRARPPLLDPGSFKSKYFRLGISSQTLQQIALGGADDRASALPADGARVQRDGGRPLARAALAQHVRGRAARREARPASGSPSKIILRRLRAAQHRRRPS